MHEDYLASLHSQIITGLGYRRLMVSEAFGFFLDYIFEVHAQYTTFQWVTRSRKSKKDRLQNAQNKKDKRTNKDLQNIT
jgi:hypothetical protein